MLGSPLHRYRSLGSTNDLAKDMAARGASEGTAVLADEQTEGRGRRGRSWSSPAGEGIYLSVILRPEVRPAVSPLITLSAAVAVAETLALDLGLEADIKWPNDVLVGGRKICGILVESATESDLIQYMVVGIGVNLAQREFPDEIRDSATSILLESKRPVAADDLLRMLFGRLDRWYRLSTARPQEVVERWEQLSSCASGCEVRISSSDQEIEGVTRGLSANGALLLELGDGRRCEIISGEVSLRKARAINDT